VGRWVGYSVVGRDREATLCVYKAAYVLVVGDCVCVSLDVDNVKARFVKGLYLNVLGYIY